MDAGTNARELLEGKQLFLKHGWIGLVLRSQADINKKADIMFARKAEAAFFANHPHYGGPGMRTGVDTLVQTLQKLLERRLRAAVPRINSTILSNVRACEGELRALGGDPPSDRGGRLHAVLTLVESVEKAFAAMLESGRGGERVRAVFERSYPAAVNAQPFNSLLRCEGARRAGAVPSGALTENDSFGGGVVIRCTDPTLMRRALCSLRGVNDIINSADGLQPHLLAPELGVRRLVRDAVQMLRKPTDAVADGNNHRRCDD